MKKINNENLPSNCYYQKISVSMKTLNTLQIRHSSQPVSKHPVNRLNCNSKQNSPFTGLNLKACGISILRFQDILKITFLVSDKDWRHHIVTHVYFCLHINILYTLERSSKLLHKDIQLSIIFLSYFL